LITHVFIQEPGGNRELQLPLLIGSASHCDIRTPNFAADESLKLFSEGDLVCIESSTPIVARIDGELIEPGVVRTVREGAVLVLGETRITFSYQGNRLLLSIQHLEGNRTIAPLQAAVVTSHDEDQRDIAINIAAQSPLHESVEKTHSEIASTAPWLPVAVVVVLLVAALIFLLRFERISVEVVPASASVNFEGLDWSSGGSVFALPGKRQIRIDAEGYRGIEREIDIQPNSDLKLQFRLEPLPGVLDVDTGGIAATAYIDGVEIGALPGELEVSSGTKTLLLKADRHLDFVQEITVE